MRFSVVIPVYNTEKYLSECLKSVSAQSFSDYDVILVDDGSTDGSPAVCDAFSNLDSRIRVIHKQNQGQLAARIDGIKAASGEYIVFCDSDDKLERRALEILDTKIKAYKPDGVMYRLRRMTTHGLLRSPKETSFDDYLVSGKAELLRKLFSFNGYISMCLKCFKRELFNTEEFEDFYNLRIAEDFIQSLYLFSNSSSVLFIPDELYNYRNNPDSTINRERKAENYTIDFSISRFVFDFVKKNSFFTEKDVDDQRLFTVQSIIERLSEISNLPVSYERKVQLLEQIKNDSFFKENITGFDVSLLSGNGRSLYDMFLCSDYKSLIRLEKQAYLPKGIKHFIANLF